MRALLVPLTLIAAGLLVLAVWFYFIPAFQGDIPVPATLEFAGFKIHYYGLLLAAGILASFFVAAAFAPRAGMRPGDIEGLLPWIVVFGFIGARAYFVALSWDHYQGNMWEIFQIWKGGLSIYGAIVGVVLAVALLARKRALPALKILDLMAVAVPLAQVLGRFGNFFNQEAFGRPTELPWKMFVEAGVRPSNYLASQYFHPTFLYEALWNFMVFLVMIFLARRHLSRPAGGFLLGVYLILYSVGRFLIEDLRLDSFFWRGVRVDQMVALLAIVAGLIIFYRSYDEISVR